MKLRRAVTVLVSLSAVVACSSSCGGQVLDVDVGADASPAANDSGARPLDCAWLAGPNCWTSAWTTIAACLGPDITENKTFGTFSANRHLCRPSVRASAMDRVTAHSYSATGTGPHGWGGGDAIGPGCDEAIGPGISYGSGNGSLSPDFSGGGTSGFTEIFDCP